MMRLTPEERAAKLAADEEKKKGSRTRTLRSEIAGGLRRLCGIN